MSGTRIKGWDLVTASGVKGFPRGLLSGGRGDDWLHPVEISKRLQGNDPEFFSLIDTRTRYWRYFILRGPNKKLSRAERQRVSKTLHRILEHNADGPLRGVGGIEFRRLRETKRGIGQANRDRWVRRLEIAYGTKARAMWGAAAEESDASLACFAATRLALLRKPMHGFFDRKLKSHVDGRARALFRRLLVQQAASLELSVAEDFANLFRRHPNDSVFDALGHAKWGTFKSEAAVRVFLARVVPWVLFRIQDQRSIYVHAATSEDDNEAIDVAPVIGTPEFAASQLKLARLCIHFFKKGGAALHGHLSPAQVTRIVGLLKAAVRNGKAYEEPLTAPKLAPGKTIQTLFPGLRLSAFKTLLNDTEQAV